MTTAVNPLASSSAATSQVQANQKATQSKDTCLKLLVAQLKYQNPMSPTDGTQFLQQTAQFTMVEKLEDLSTKSDALLKAQQGAEAIGMLGQKVTATAASGSDITGIVTGMRVTADGPVLKVNGGEVALSAVKSVDKPA